LIHIRLIHFSDITLNPFSENEDPEKIVSRHIKLLHQYNESKDATQILIGRLAALKQMTVRQIHIDLEFMEDD